MAKVNIIHSAVHKYSRTRL